MLIVLWNLLELVLVVRESIYTEIPEDTERKVAKATHSPIQDKLRYVPTHESKDER